MQRVPGKSESVAGEAHRRSAEPWRRGAVVSVLIVALAAQEWSAGHAHVRTSAAAWAAAPVAVVPLAVDPQVACPTKALGDCDLVQRFLIANEVVSHRSHILIISRFGGLYGP
jgi:hypothetical protein